ncbi:MAG: MnhB domain-containing protein [Fodinibius sp.]|nr:MnhB domain-containing protein [Fodinibius sp.]
MTNKEHSPIILLGCRFLSPYIMIFGFYVIFHGHYSPGGGFQGGTLLAASLLLVRIASGTEIAKLQFKDYLATPYAGTRRAHIFWNRLWSIAGRRIFS